MQYRITIKGNYGFIRELCFDFESFDKAYEGAKHLLESSKSLTLEQLRIVLIEEI